MKTNSGDEKIFDFQEEGEALRQAVAVFRNRCFRFDGKAWTEVR